MRASDDTTTTAADPRWARVVARDPTADGAFWYAVLTTGVYCRPSCPSRAANPANVTLHATLADARATGARPCLRCRPDEAPGAATAARIARAAEVIASAETPPSLATLAADAGLSAGHFHRLFKAHTGLTPRAYAAAQRAGKARVALAGGDGVTQAIHAAGYGSSGRFYAEAAEVLGMAPGRYRRGGAGETLRFAVGPCALGHVLVASSDSGIAAILLGDDPAALLGELQDRFRAATLVGGDAGYEATVARVIGLVDAPATGLDLPLDVRGTVFQQRVWQALRAIPPGETATYADIAANIGAPRAIRAVATACAANAHAVAIPCHRVVRRDGALAGYRWGIGRKRDLLARERG